MAISDEGPLLKSAMQQIQEESYHRGTAQEAELAADSGHRQQQLKEAEQLNQNEMPVVRTQSHHEIEKPLENSAQSLVPGKSPNLANSINGQMDDDKQKRSSQDMPEGDLNQDFGK